MLYSSARLVDQASRYLSTTINLENSTYASRRTGLVDQQASWYCRQKLIQNSTHASRRTGLVDQASRRTSHHVSSVRTSKLLDYRRRRHQASRPG